ncbi:hypothetical protein GALMADRAFT_266538 [Galerina marginata CBS 339.88]|uniref:MYND-type domain-containing protein n=1 Tax=Galerina marginata (strain CBS 339.88) TaxID=685588 RepID=A0A067T4F4_GALM3|nr:hypothetical protein GALMADRAFT_266538 [Galerina marginata CBS 339.88]
MPSKVKVSFDGQKPIKLPHSTPQLPPDLVQSFESDTTCPPYRSIIFTTEFNVARHLMAAGEDGPEMKITTDLEKGMRRTVGTLPGAPYLVKRSTWLHLAAAIGDIPLFYEILRTGCHLEVKDELGHTPLFSGCNRLSSLMLNGKPRTFPGIDGARIQEHAKRIEKVCILLVEQRAALDTTFNGKTVLHLACATNSWDLIKVLLQHGANPAPASIPRSQHCVSLFKTSAEKERFKALTNLPGPPSRPARPCPCWSGLTLENCHAREGADQLPYPPHFICRCKSRKIYSKCCLKKGVEWTEIWDPEEMWIQPNRVVKVPAPSTPQGCENLAQQFERLASVNESIADGTAGFSGADLISGAKRFTASMMDVLLQSDHVDRGFAYAAKKVDFMPRPWTGGIPKIEQKIRMDEWNSAVDEYIALGTDSRRRAEIENESKIGLGGGPLHHLCEEETCFEAPEGRTPRKGGPPVKLLVCAGCKKAMFCSKECQRKAWPKHKRLCKSGRAQEQLLSSQQSVTEMHELWLNNPMA